MSFPFDTFFLAGLRQSVFGSFGSFFMVLLGLLGLVFGVFAVVQTRRWPSTVATKAKPRSKKEPEKPAEPAPVPIPVRRAATTTDLVRIRFPSIDERHPDVWDMSMPLDVLVRVDASRIPAASAAEVRLTRSRGTATTELGRAAPDDEGRVRFTVRFDRVGEEDLVAELRIDQKPQGQAVRAVRVVDYRAEIVETFEDFVAWAGAQFEFVDQRLTAREFVDRYADARAGTPTGPLETIADLYEVANYSEHPVDRATYLRMVDAFLDLEDAGALEGPEAR